MNHQTARKFLSKMKEALHIINDAHQDNAFKPTVHIEGIARMDALIQSFDIALEDEKNEPE